MEYLALVPLLFGLSFLSGMLGLGVAFIAIPGFDWGLLVATSIAAVIGSALGARFTAAKVKSVTLARVFAVALVALAAQRAWILLS